MRIFGVVTMTLYDFTSVRAFLAPVHAVQRSKDVQRVGAESYRYTFPLRGSMETGPSAPEKPVLSFPGGGIFFWVSY